ncbi:SUMF1/EgtB/PvdO family nonheme iron enzyme [Cloacibacterium sp. Arc13]|uniref:formylglycine-generating enzyme family protein n=1 Tax=unclassified Cloacibacterium TaxID=2620870 RepID=UPI00352D3009
MKILKCTLIALMVVVYTNLLATTNPPSPNMVFVKGGSFIMGNGAEDKKWAHAETVADFSMSRYEVTVGEYKTFCTATNRAMPEAPYWGWNDQHPIVNVSYNDAIAYCQWLSKTLGVTYRLPTEAEWEFAANGGTQSKGYTYAGSNDINQVAWYYKNANYQMQAVGQKKPNELGLFDMTGNAWEWCSDWYVGTTVAGKITEGSHRVLKGGSSMSFETNSTNIQRNYRATNRAIYSAGFRLVTTAKTTANPTLTYKANLKAEYSEFKCNTKRTGYAILCRALESNRLVEDEESLYTYEYEQELARLAQADYEADSDIFFIEKIHLYVTRCSCCLVCDTIRTAKKEISLLKVAVATGNLDFFERAVTVYRYPLDLVDEIDGMNAMDYVYEDIEYWLEFGIGSTPVKENLKLFYIVKAFGAKFYKHKHLNN